MFYRIISKTYTLNKVLFFLSLIIVIASLITNKQINNIYLFFFLVFSWFLLRNRLYLHTASINGSKDQLLLDDKKYRILISIINTCSIFRGIFGIFSCIFASLGNAHLVRYFGVISISIVFLEFFLDNLRCHVLLNFQKANASKINYIKKCKLHIIAIIFFIVLTVLAPPRTILYLLAIFCLTTACMFMLRNINKLLKAHSKAKISILNLVILKFATLRGILGTLATIISFNSLLSYNYLRILGLILLALNFFESILENLLHHPALINRSYVTVNNS